MGWLIGAIVGIVVTVMAMPPALNFTCPTFFEQGCGDKDSLMFWLAVLIALAIGVLSGAMVGGGIAWLTRGGNQDRCEQKKKRDPGSSPG